MIGIYTAELYPTSIRSTAIGLFSQAARVGSIAAPFMLMAGSQVPNISPIFIPYMVFGSLSCLAGLLVLLLPETLGAAMPESMEDMKQLQSVFTAKPWKQGGGWLAVLRYIVRTRAAPCTQTATITTKAEAVGGQTSVSSDVDADDSFAQCDIVQVAQRCGKGSAKEMIATPGKPAAAAPAAVAGVVVTVDATAAAAALSCSDCV